MDRAQHEALFRRGMAMCRRGLLSEAAVVFRRLIEAGSEEPLHLSYCGILTATVGNRSDGIRLCERAMQLGAYEPQVIVNLARVYESSGGRIKAVKLLRRGLREMPGHAGMLAEINRLSPRRRPPLSMVGREHWLNKQLAILLAKVGGQSGSASGVSAEKASPRPKRPMAVVHVNR